MKADARKRLDKMNSPADFGHLLKEVVAGLRDGHCEVSAAHLMAPTPRAWPHLLCPIKEGVLFTGMAYSLVGSGIELGDVLTEVNDRPIEDWVSEAARLGPMASPWCNVSLRGS